MELAEWLQAKAARRGVSQSEIVCEQLERLRQREEGGRKFMRLAGTARIAPRDLSTLRGFAKPRR